MGDCDHDLARFDNGMVACVLCYHVLSDDEFHHWLDHSRRLGRRLRDEMGPMPHRVNGVITEWRR